MLTLNNESDSTIANLALAQGSESSVDTSLYCQVTSRTITKAYMLMNTGLIYFGHEYKVGMAS